jgi:hypothetical protein
MAQQQLDTLYANNTMNTALFFPEPIEKAITGNPNFVFTFDREKSGHLGLLKAMPGTESNLFVVTQDGSIYSYILNYRENLSILYRFIDKADRIGTENTAQMVKNSEPVLVGTTNTWGIRNEFLDSLLGPIGGHLAIDRYRGLKMQLKRIVYYGDIVYLSVNLTNRSGIDFKVDYLKVFVVNGNAKTKSSYQRTEQIPTGRYKMPSILMNDQSYGVVLALPKFVLGRMETLQVELKEKHGNRKLLLKK